MENKHQTIKLYQMNILEVIQQYGLSIRQIPQEITSKYSFIHHEGGNKIVYETVSCKYDVFKKKHLNDPNFIFNDDSKTVLRVFTQKTEIPKHAGYWMCKQVKNANSLVLWETKKSNLASTLEGSIRAFLNSVQL